MPKTFRRCGRAAVAVEAALVFPILFTLIFAAIEVSVVFTTFGAMQSAGRDVTRQLSINAMSQGAVAAEIRARLPAWARDAAAISVVESTPGVPETNQIDVEIRLPADSASPFRAFTALATGWTLTTAVSMKQEMPL